MHANPRFAWADREAMRAFVRAQGFGALFLTTPEGPRVAHVPVNFLGPEAIGFHVARGNALTPHLAGARALFVVQGSHGYVSPDWYGEDNQVPTWNYLAVEIEGVARRMETDALMAQLDALSAAQEARLAPKPVWTRDKMAPGLADKMAGAIVGFRLEIEHWRGTRKLGQNKSRAALAGAADGLDALGRGDLAALMRAALDEA